MGDIVKIGNGIYRNLVREGVTFLPRSGLPHVMREARVIESRTIAELKVQLDLARDSEGKLARRLAASERKLAKMKSVMKQRLRGKELETAKVLNNARLEALKLSQQEYFRHDFCRWPRVPMETVEILETGENLPQEAGVYFLWTTFVEYVGQTINLRGRVRSSHNKIPLTDPETTRASFLIVEEKDLTFAESFYIGILKPRLNVRTPAG